MVERDEGAFCYVTLRNVRCDNLVPLAEHPVALAGAFLRRLSARALAHRRRSGRARRRQPGRAARRVVRAGALASSAALTPRRGAQALVGVV